jgi:hypothetical protein
MEKHNLEQDKIKHGFKVPDQYFETLESKIMAQITTEVVPQTKVFAIESMITKWTALAASLILIASIGYWFYTPAEAISIPAESLETYLAAQSLNDYYLTELLTESDLKSLEKKQEIDLQEIENYLSNHIETDIYYYN